MKTDLFDYDLPPERIAQTPAARRDESRLLVVDRKTRKLTHARFSLLPQFLPPRARLFRNNAAVIKARLRGVKPTGGAVECFLLRPAANGSDWVCLLKPGRRLQVGAQFGQEGVYAARVLAKNPEGEAVVRFEVAGGGDVLGLSERIGAIPLPPYIARAATPEDERRYQTVYADPNQKVAVAAPTAGLHFSEEVLADLRARGVPFYDITLNVGLGTFRPVKVENIEEHPIHREFYTIPKATLDALRAPEDGPRVAVGTTSLRAIEDALAKDAPAGKAWNAEADLYVYPPRAFKGVDALITNFHLPRSTLLCLVAAFLTPESDGGIAWLKEIYAEALAHDYRFFSYGDAMLIL